MQTEWNLSFLYQNDDEWKKDTVKLDELIKKLESLVDGFLEDERSFLEYLELKIKGDILIETIYCYPRRHMDLDSSETHYKKMFEVALGLYERLQLLEKKYEEGILAKPKKVEQYIQSRKLAKYKRYVELTLRKKEHQVDREMLDEYMKNVNVGQNIRTEYVEFINGLDFGTVELEGESVPLNRITYNKLILNKEQGNRKKIFESYYGVYAKNIDRFVDFYIRKLRGFIELSKLEKFDSALGRTFFELELPSDLLDNYIKAISANLDVAHDLVKLKKNVSGLEEFHIYDSSAPLNEFSKKEYTLDEAISLVKKSLSILGDDYISIIDEMFLNGWVDVYPKKNKRTIPSTGISYGGLPYVLLNFDETFDSVKTLAHEIGHAEHVYFSKTHNDFCDFEFSLFVTEIVAKVNELLFYNYCIKETQDENQKIGLLSSIIGSLTNSIFGQMLITEFDHAIIKKISNGEELNSEDISQIYLDFSKKYNGDDLVYDDLLKYGWANLPHLFFQEPYYNYQYSLGLCLAAAIVKRIESKDEDFIKKYREFLYLGKSVSLMNALETLGINILDDASFVDEGVGYLKDKLDDLKKTLAGKPKVFSHN